MNKFPTRVFKLKNGLTLVIQTDHFVPLVAVSITYRVGSLDEEPSRAGFAHLFEHLMFQGTNNLLPNEISRLVESQGGMDNAYTMKTNTTYHEVVPSWALESILWAEADRMRGLLISPRELEIEKKVVLEEMGQTYGNQPYRRATDAVMGNLAFKQWQTAHPTIGIVEDLKAATLKDVKDFYEKHYAPNNAVIALVGDVEAAQGLKWVKTYFSGLKRRNHHKRIIPAEEKIKSVRRKRVIDHLAKNPLLVCGWHTPRRGSKDFWALIVLSAILGAGEDSPLYEVLVKNKRMALSASSHVPYWSSHYNSIGSDLFALFVSPRAEADLNQIIELCDQVLSRFRISGPTLNEIDRAKIQIERAWLDGHQALIDRAQVLSSYVALIGDPSEFWKDFERVLKITQSDIRQSVRRWLRSNNRVILEIVPGTSQVEQSHVATNENLPEAEDRPAPNKPKSILRSNNISANPVSLPAMTRYCSILTD